jgi:cytoskeleton protein RodZ
LLFNSIFIFPRAKGTQGEPKQGEAVSNKPSLEFGSLAELGAYLKDEREKAGLSRSEVTIRTKITLDQLSNMEAGTFTGLAPVYAKGFLRSYAQTINLDHTEIVREYKRHTGELGANPYKPLTSKYRESDIVSEDGIGLGSVLAVFLAVLVGVVLLIALNTSFREFAAQYLTFLQPSEEAETDSTPPPPAPAAPAPQAQPQAQAQAQPSAPIIPATAALGAPTSLPLPDPRAQANLAPAEPAAPPAPPAPPAPAAPTAPVVPASSPQASGQAGVNLAGQSSAPQEGGNLVLTAMDTTWAPLTVDNGPLIHLYFKEGESRRFNSSKSIRITAGNGKALQAEWNGIVYQQLGPEGPTERIFPPR